MQIPLNGYSAAFLQLRQAKPQVPSNGVVNAASYTGGGVSPGEIVAVFGEAMGPASLIGADTSSPGVVDNLLAGTRVWFDGIAAPLVYTSAKQVSAIVPYEVAGKTSTDMRVEYLGAMSAPVTIPVVAAVPGIFVNDQSGSGEAAVINADGSRNSAANPASRGSFVSLFATGEGQTTPLSADGRIASGLLTQPNLPVTAQLDGVPAKVLYAGGAIGIVAGGFQINIEIPANVTPGPAVSVVVTIGTASSQPGVTIAVK
jgi:uncharacterized protein (TIGR03437 family)